MFQLTVMYDHPADPAKFDKYYDEVHTPLAKTFPGLQRLSVSRPASDPGGNKPAYHLIAVLEWEDEAAFGAAMESPEGQEIVGDVPNFCADGAVTMAMGPARVA